MMMFISHCHDTRLAMFFSWRLWSSGLWPRSRSVWIITLDVWEGLWSRRICQSTESRDWFSFLFRFRGLSMWLSSMAAMDHTYLCAPFSFGLLSLWVWWDCVLTQTCFLTPGICGCLWSASSNCCSALFSLLLSLVCNRSWQNMSNILIKNLLAR